MNYSTTNSSGTVSPRVKHFLLFPAPHGGAFVALCTLLKLIPLKRMVKLVMGVSGLTLTGALGSTLRSVLQIHFLFSILSCILYCCIFFHPGGTSHGSPVRTDPFGLH